MTDRFVTFHDRGTLVYAFLGVHIVGVASETGKWMSGLTGDHDWRSGSGSLESAKAAIAAHVREWYDAAHQPLAEGQAARICDQLKRRPRPIAAIRIKEIEPEAMLLRLKRDGVVSTYVLPPVVDGVAPQPTTLAQLRMYCVSAHETAEHKLRACPADRLAEHEFAVFAGLQRLIDSCSASEVIKGELKRIAIERAAKAESAVCEACDGSGTAGMLGEGHGGACGACGGKGAVAVRGAPA
jgi:hypothetical protein